MRLLKTFIAFLFSFLIYSNVFSQVESKTSVFLDKSEIENYLGEYRLDDQGQENIRSIIMKDTGIYYVVDEKTHIPLRPLSKSKFNLYPSKTNIIFIFGEDGGVKEIVIEKGSGGKITGKKIKKP